MPIAIGYCRVSTAEQAENGWSIEAQERRIRALADAAQLDLSDVLSDPDASGKDMRRPAMVELNARLRGGLCDAVVVAKLDRLTRRVVDLQAFLELLQKARRCDGKGLGVDLLSCEGEIDTRSAHGRLVIGLVSLISQWEREVISERTIEALQARKARGLLTGQAPFGMRARADGVLEPEPSEQEILDRVRRELAAGRSHLQIADGLTRDGIRTRRGGAFSRQGVYRMAKVHGLLPERGGE